MTPIDPWDASAIFEELQLVYDGIERKKIEIRFIERFAFYERARNAFAIEQTGKWRLYDNISLEGVVRSS
ncbi:hypothetical protein JJQ51_00340 [Rhizobium sp. AG207R]|nr:RbsD/FucU domain-containing protein [Rhizobium sp. AG207R]MCZ3374370.1 hypothetical protein [Rhizobium sp. AG207R]